MHLFHRLCCQKYPKLENNWFLFYRLKIHLITVPLPYQMCTTFKVIIFFRMFAFVPLNFPLSYTPCSNKLKVENAKRAQRGQKSVISFQIPQNRLQCPCAMYWLSFRSIGPFFVIFVHSSPGTWLVLFILMIFGPQKPDLVPLWATISRRSIFEISNFDLAYFKHPV